MPRARNIHSLGRSASLTQDSWAGGSLGEERAQARRAAQAQRGQENGGWVQVSGGAREGGPGAGAARGGGRGTPEDSWGRGRALPTRGAEG